MEDLEKEIIENCGEEFLTEVKSHAKGGCFEKGCLSIALSILVLIFYVIPALSIVPDYLNHKSLANGEQLSATISAIEFEDWAFVSYEYNHTDQHYTGVSKLLKSDGTKYNVSDSLPIYISGRNPSNSRAVEAIHPLRNAGRTVMAWVCLAFIIIPIILVLFKRKKGKKPSNIEWLEYMTSSDRPSPRAYLLESLENDNLPNCSLESALLPSILQETELKLIADESGDLFAEDNIFTDKDRPDLSLPRMLMRMKYAERWLCQYPDKVVLPDIPSPVSLASGSNEDHTSIGLNLLKKLASNGSADEPEYDAIDLDLSQLNENDIIEKIKKAGKIESDLRKQMHINAAAEDKAIEKAQRDAGVLFEEKNNLIQHFLNGDEIESENFSVADQDLQMLVRSLLYLFYTTPWCKESLRLELPMKRMDGHTVLIEIDYQPDENIKLSRRYDAKYEEAEIHSEDESDIKSGVFTGKIQGIEYSYILQPSLEDDPDLLAISFPLKGIDSEYKHSSKGAEEDFLQGLDAQFHKRDLPGISLLVFFFFKVIFWPMTVPPFSLKFFKSCSVESNINYRSLMKWLLRKEDVRSSLLHLMEKGYEIVRISNGEISVLRPGSPSDQKELDQEVHGILPHLKSITKGLSAKIVSHHETQPKRERIRLVCNTLIVLVVILYPFIGIKTDTRTLDSDAAFMMGLMYGLPLWVLFIYYTWWATRFSYGGGCILNLGAWILGFVFIILGTAGSIGIINTHFDESTPSEYIQTILRKEKRDSGSYVVIENRGDGNVDYAIRVDSTTYDSIDPKEDKVRLVLKEGALGFLWIEEQEIISSKTE